MATVTITIHDQEGGVKVKVESDPDIPDNSEDETPAQALAMDFIDAVMANATEIEEHSLN